MIPCDPSTNLACDPSTNFLWKEETKKSMAISLIYWGWWLLVAVPQSWPWWREVAKVFSRAVLVLKFTSVLNQMGAWKTKQKEKKILHQQEYPSLREWRERFTSGASVRQTPTIRLGTSWQRLLVGVRKVLERAFCSYRLRYLTPV